ncbi:MAG: DUF4833 domain-containing protein [Bacteroidia bacterium]|nr:DUF4833 domain-containing protein [Bacteroidia bacterium]
MNELNRYKRSYLSGARFICFLFLLPFSLLKSQNIVPKYSGFPVPVMEKDMMFYLQRTVDYNTVIYELNYEVPGKLNAEKPIKIYWIDYENGGKITQLTYAQNKFAYGIESKLIDKTYEIFEIRLVSYKKKTFTLKKHEKKGTHQLFAKLNGKDVILQKIFVNIVGGTYLKPKVKDITLTGIDIHNGEEIVEIVVP